MAYHADITTVLYTLTQTVMSYFTVCIIYEGHIGTENIEVMESLVKQKHSTFMNNLHY